MSNEQNIGVQKLILMWDIMFNGVTKPETDEQKIKYLEDFIRCIWREYINGCIDDYNYNDLVNKLKENIQKIRDRMEKGE
jgi:hypothetical protein